MGGAFFALFSDQILFSLIPCGGSRVRCVSPALSSPPKLIERLIKKFYSPWRIDESTLGLLGGSCPDRILLVAERPTRLCDFQCLQIISFAPLDPPCHSALRDPVLFFKTYRLRSGSGTAFAFPTALEARQGLFSKRFCVAKNSADGGLSACAREFSICVNRSISARSVAA